MLSCVQRCVVVVAIECCRVCSECRATREQTCLHMLLFCLVRWFNTRVNSLLPMLWRGKENVGQLHVMEAPMWTPHTTKRLKTKAWLAMCRGHKMMTGPSQAPWGARLKNLEYAARVWRQQHVLQHRDSR